MRKSSSRKEARAFISESAMWAFIIIGVMVYVVLHGLH